MARNASIGTCICALLMMAGVKVSGFELSESLNKEAFPPKLFPELSNASSDAIFLEGLAQRFPKRILKELPEAPTHSKIAPLIQELPRNITYIRIHDFATQLETTTEHLANPALIIDLRYVFSANTDPFFETLKNLDRQHAIIVLTNKKSSGPWETQLADLQASGTIMTVGTATFGNTGVYEKFWEQPTYYKLVDEKLTQTGKSILQSGVVPDVSIEVSPQEDYQSYYAVNKGYSVGSLINLKLDDVDTEKKEDSEDNANGDKPLQDAILQRGVEIIVALQILGKLPM